MDKRIRQLLVLIFLLAASQPLVAQVEFSAYGGWLWTASVKMYSYPPYYYGQNAKVDDLGNYGFRAGVSGPYDTAAEFEWNHTETNFIYRDTNGARSVIPVAANYYMMGALKEVPNGPMVGYAILNFGVVNFKNTNDDSYSINRFVAGFGGGVKYYINDMIGFRLQGRFLAPMQFAGISIGCGIGTGGGGCGTGVNSYSATIQGDFTGAIILRFGDY